MQAVIRHLGRAVGVVRRGGGGADSWRSCAAFSSQATPQASALGWEVRPVGNALGAEVLGVDLGTAGPKELEAIREALLAYQVVFFRDQHTLTPTAHRAMAEYFGPLQQHPAYPHVEGHPEITVLENDAARPSLIEKWHTDMTFMASPPLGSILHGIIIPDGGRGDTEFLSMAAAYDELDPALKQRLDKEKLQAEHSFEYGFKESLAKPGGRERLAKAIADNPPVAHPVVRTHPDSGRRTLFVNGLFTTRVLGLSEKESTELLEHLYDHMLQDRFRYRFKWRPNSVAFWDNRITQHRPINDYYPAHRKLQRITVEGDRPK
jgi:taurine dioxygenase